MKPEEQEILSLKNAYKSYCYCFENKKTANIKEHEKIILESKDAQYAYMFAKDILRANIKELEKVVLESKNAYYAYNFARDIPGANLKEHEKIILESKKAGYAYYFARDIEGANLELFKDILENSAYKEEFASLCSEYKKNQMNKEEQEILDLKDPEKSYFYCLNNKETANVKEHEKVIIESKDAHYAYYFARAIQGANIKELEKVILESKDPRYAYRFAMNISGENIKELEKVVIESENAECAYRFARDIQGANLELFKDILENSKYKEEFANLYSEYKSNSSSNFGSEKSKSVINNNSTKQFKKENNKMSNSMDFFKINLIEGAYAGTAVVAVDNIKKAILAAAKSAGADEMSLAIASAFLDTPAGKAILSILVGSGVKFIPVDIVQSNPHLQKVAEKCIQNAGSEGAQYAFNLATTFILPALLNAIQSNPQISLLEGMKSADKLRVSTPANNQVSEEDNSNVVEGAFNKVSRAGLK